LQDGLVEVCGKVPHGVHRRERLGERPGLQARNGGGLPKLPECVGLLPGEPQLGCLCKARANGVFPLRNLQILHALEPCNYSRGCKGGVLYKDAEAVRDLVRIVQRGLATRNVYGSHGPPQ
jgi:hypothetical protein